MKELNQKGEQFYSQWKERRKKKWLFIIYLTLNDDADVVKGIKTLKAGEIWNYENLIIHKENDDTLIVQNELFWFEENELPTEKLNECFNLVLGDFQRLQKNKDFDDFTKNERVKIQIFDNSGSNIPLFEKLI